MRELTMAESSAYGNKTDAAVPKTASWRAILSAFCASLIGIGLARFAYTPLLPAIVDAAGGQLEVLFDSGIRSGQDLLKALALGARAGLIGKAFLYGLGAGGEAGVTRAIEIIRRELSVSMALTGQRDARHIAPNILLPRNL